MIKRLRGILQPFLPAPDSQAVLDIGCGMGFALLTLKDMGFTELRGIDVDAEQVRCAQKFGLHVEQVQSTFTFLDQHAGQFDIVLMFDVLEHIPVDEQICIMRFVNLALKPGGRVILQVPNATLDDGDLAASHRLHALRYLHTGIFVVCAEKRGVRTNSYSRPRPFAAAAGGD